MAEPLFRKITIVGVGLLGGSIGKAARKHGLGREICGFSRHPKKIVLAKRLGLIDTGTDCFAEAVENSDLIVLCSPVEDIKMRLRQLKQLGITRTLVTDVGSTKREIIRAARGLNFVGSHPLAGSEQSGMKYANHRLLEQSLCIVIEDGAQKKSIATVRRFWNDMGSRVVVMKARVHDQALGFTSHLPHAVAFALMAAVPPHLEHLAAGGLKDSTRIAMSSPELWKDIFLSNRGNILKGLSVFERSLKRLKDAIAARNTASLLKILKTSRQKRGRLPS